jgi:hypothetical protein
MHTKKRNQNPANMSGKNIIALARRLHVFGPYAIELRKRKAEFDNKEEEILRGIVLAKWESLNKAKAESPAKLKKQEVSIDAVVVEASAVKTPKDATKVIPEHKKLLNELKTKKAKVIAMHKLHYGETAISKSVRAHVTNVYAYLRDAENKGIIEPREHKVVASKAEVSKQVKTVKQPRAVKMIGEVKPTIAKTKAKAQVSANA